MCQRRWSHPKCNLSPFEQANQVVELDTTKCNILVTTSAQIKIKPTDYGAGFSHCYLQHCFGIDFFVHSGPHWDLHLRSNMEADTHFWKNLQIVGAMSKGLKISWCRNELSFAGMTGGKLYAAPIKCRSETSSDSRWDLSCALVFVGSLTTELLNYMLQYSIQIVFISEYSITSPIGLHGFITLVCGHSNTEKKLSTLQKPLIRISYGAEQTTLHTKALQTSREHNIPHQTACLVFPNPTMIQTLSTPGDNSPGLQGQRSPKVTST